MKYSKLRLTASIKKYLAGGWFSGLVSNLGGIVGKEGLNMEELGNMVSNFGKDGSKFENFGNWISNIGSEEANKKHMLSEGDQETFGELGNIVDNVSKMDERLTAAILSAKIEDSKKTLKDTSKEAIGQFVSGNWAEAVGTLANKTVDTVEDELMGDKNFNQNSALIDNSVRFASNNLKKLGPYGLLAAGILETGNFIDKAVGKTVQGFDVGEVGPGFNGIETNWDSQSFRGTQSKKMKQVLARRTEALNMALAASEITQNELFLMNARMNSIDNVLNANRMALVGGLDTSLLGG